MTNNPSGDPTMRSRGVGGNFDATCRQCGWHTTVQMHPPLSSTFVTRCEPCQMEVMFDVELPRAADTPAAEASQPTDAPAPAPARTQRGPDRPVDLG